MHPILSLPTGMVCGLLEQMCKRVRDHARVRTEVAFWQMEMREYVRWYSGKSSLYGIPPPRNTIRSENPANLMKRACIEWNRVFQGPKYLHVLDLDSRAFVGQRVLDICCGPHPSALCFEDCEILGLDHLMSEYSRIGYPIHEYDKRYHFVKGKTEKTPFPSGSFDAVIAVNAIDHVDDILKTSMEIRRILRPGGTLRLNVEYHDATVTEPVALSDEVMATVFSWADLEKIGEVDCDLVLDHSFNGCSDMRGAHEQVSQILPKTTHIWGTI